MVRLDEPGDAEEGEPDQASAAGPQCAVHERHDEQHDGEHHEHAACIASREQVDDRAHLPLQLVELVETEHELLDAVQRQDDEQPAQVVANVFHEASGLRSDGAQR
jgi:hypothetical protein